MQVFAVELPYSSAPVGSENKDGGAFPFSVGDPTILKSRRVLSLRTLFSCSDAAPFTTGVNQSLSKQRLSTCPTSKKEKVGINSLSHHLVPVLVSSHVTRIADTVCVISLRAAGVVHKSD